MGKGRDVVDDEWSDDMGDQYDPNLVYGTYEYGFSSSSVDLLSDVACGSTTCGEIMQEGVQQACGKGKGKGRSTSIQGIGRKFVSGLRSLRVWNSKGREKEEEEKGEEEKGGEEKGDAEDVPN